MLEINVYTICLNRIFYYIYINLLVSCKLLFQIYSKSLHVLGNSSWNPYTPVQGTTLTFCIGVDEIETGWDWWMIPLTTCTPCGKYEHQQDVWISSIDQSISYFQNQTLFLQIFYIILKLVSIGFQLESSWTNQHITIFCMQG